VVTQLGSSKATKKNKEKEVLKLMISLYCRGNHNSNDDLCESCTELLKYSHERSDKCPFIDKKTFCSSCKVHCYNEEMRSRIRKVMRYSGPRMLFHHPLLLLKHMFSK